MKKRTRYRILTMVYAGAVVICGLGTQWTKDIGEITMLAFCAGVFLTAFVVYLKKWADE
jgi:hypothetical protein